MSCGKCHRPLTGKNVIDLSDQSLHDECFCCVRCGRGFPELKFVREGGEFYHLICLEEMESQPSTPTYKSTSTPSYQPTSTSYEANHQYSNQPSNQTSNQTSNHYSSTSHNQPSNYTSHYSSSSPKTQTYSSSPTTTTRPSIHNEPRPSSSYYQTYQTPSNAQNFLHTTPNSADDEVPAWSGQQCFLCEGRITSDGSIFPNGKFLHKKCLKCRECDQLINASEKNAYEFRGGAYYHIPDCLNRTKYENCTKCQQPLKTGSITVKGAKYHEECIGCVQCGQNMAGKDFTWKDQQICCKNCCPTKAMAEAAFQHSADSKKCPKCQKAVYPNEQAFGPNGSYWHPKCLVCNQCAAKLSSNAKLLDGLLFCTLHAKPKLNVA